MGKNIAFKNLLIAASGDFGSNRTHNDLRRWVETNGGNFTTRLSEEVTHLVCTNDHWNRQVDTVKAALTLEISIVSYDWLEDSIRSNKRHAERDYLLKNLARLNKGKKITRGKKERKALKKDARKFKKGCDDARNDIGSGTSSSTITPTKTIRKSTTKAKLPSSKSDGQLLVEVLMADAEEDDVSTHGMAKKSTASASKSAPAGKGRGAKAKATVGTTGAGKAKTMVEIGIPETRALPELSTRERDALAAARTAGKQAKDDERANKDWLFPENYHVYRDVSTNQEYRVTLTRVEMRKNKLERYQIRLYETNDQPYRYATYVRYSGKGLAPVAQVKASLGSDFQKAFKAFKDVFQEKTWTHWDDRDKAGQQVVKAANMEAMSDVVESIELSDGEKMAEMPVVEQPFIYRQYPNA